MGDHFEKEVPVFAQDELIDIILLFIGITSRWHTRVLGRCVKLRDRPCGSSLVDHDCLQRVHNSDEGPGTLYSGMQPERVSSNSRLYVVLICFSRRGACPCLQSWVLDTT